MDRLEILHRIESSGVIAVIRLNGDENLDQIICSLAQGGVTAIEITMTTPNAIAYIQNFSKKYGSEFLIGAGTVLNADVAKKVIDAGAEFVVSPILKTEIIRMSHQYHKVVFPGAFTPTEILTAWENGADVVKVFPATTLGPKYFKDIHGPLPEIKLTPTGGVSLDNAAEFMKAGAVFIGVGTALLDKKMIQNEDWSALQNRAAQFKAEVEKGRAGFPSHFGISKEAEEILT